MPHRIPKAVGRHRLAALLSVLLGLLFAGSASAWGSDGHRIVALLAEPGLTPQAQSAVRSLLATEHATTLADISTWADDVRGDPRWRHTARWHWVNLSRDPACTYVPKRDCRDGDCVIGAIHAQLAVLADPKRPLAERRDALKFVVHFVGDVHQPFHAGFADDRGGNTTQLRFDRRGWNLHALWDVAMVEQAGLSPEDYARQLPSGPALPEDTTLLSPEPALGWALESCRAILDAGLYPEGRVVGRAYLQAHRPLVEKRLRQAGNRLAAVLNRALSRPIDAGQAYP